MHEGLNDEVGADRGGADGADLELARKHALHDLVRVVHVEGYAHAGIQRLEPGQHGRQHVLAGSRGGPDDDLARDQLAEVEDLGAGALVQVEDLAAVAVEHLA